MFDRVDIKLTAREALREYRWPSVGMLVLYVVLNSFVIAISFGLGEFFLAPPLLIGLTVFFLGVWRRQDPQFDTLFDGFKRYAQSLVGILWMYLFTFLWSLLFIIPGIIKGLAYSMTPYLLADNPNLDPQKALKISMAITEGHKGDIFVMYLSFIGWEILSAFTFGILHIIFVGPYMQVAFAGMYESILSDALARRVITEADLQY